MPINLQRKLYRHKDQINLLSLLSNTKFRFVQVRRQHRKKKGFHQTIPLTNSRWGCSQVNNSNEGFNKKFLVKNMDICLNKIYKPNVKPS